MQKKRTHPRFAAAILERPPMEYLIALPRQASDAPRVWQFPRGQAQAGETPEAAMRRIAREQLELIVDVLVGQPPFLAQVGGEEVEVRYFLCAILNGALGGQHYADLRWVHRAHLREYDFDAASRPVTEWLLQSD